jgi:hypothetical protein
LVEAEAIKIKIELQIINIAFFRLKNVSLGDNLQKTPIKTLCFFKFDLKTPSKNPILIGNIVSVIFYQ